MKYLLLALLLTGCCTPKTVYVDRVVKVGTCPQVERIGLSKLDLSLIEGELYNPGNMGLFVKNYIELKNKYLFLRFEAARCQKAVDKCREGVK
jgi:hypothetical protein